MNRNLVHLSLGTVDLVRRTLTGPGRSVRLTSADAELLRYLADRAEQVVPREDIERDVWRLAPGVRSEAVPVAIRRLRSRVEADPSDPVNVLTVYGVGWRLVEGAPTRSLLPSERDAFVGRASEMLLLESWWASETRAIALTGPGGIGKTRLAQRALNQLGHPTVLCDLAHCADIPSLIRAVAAALDVPLLTSDATDAIGYALRARPAVILLLDAAEGVVDCLEVTVGEWLDRAPQLRVLITSRAMVRLRGQQSLAVGPLTDEDASALFCARCASEAKDLGPLIAELDGIPLAIELAAARTRLLTVDQLLAGLKSRIELLSDGRRSLRRALEQTVALVQPWALSALAQLSVVVGTFQPEEAEALLDLSPWPDAPWSLDVLDELVGASLVLRTHDGLRVLRPVRPLLADILDGGALIAAEERHAQWALARTSELDELLEANSRAVGRGDAEHAVPTALATWLILRHAGPSELGLLVLERTLALAPRDLALRDALSLVLCRLGRTADGLRVAKEAADDADDATDKARALLRLGQASRTAGGDATAVLERGLACAREAGHPLLEARTLGALATAAHLRSDPEAESLVHRALRLLPASEHRLHSRMRMILALVHADNEATARRSYTEALYHARAAGDTASEAQILGNFGGLLLWHGLLVEALEVLEGALAVHRRCGIRPSEGVVLGNIGLLHLTLGRLDEAAPQLEESLAIAREVDQPADEARGLEYLAGLAEARGRPEHAVELLADVARRWAALGRVSAQADTVAGLTGLELSGDVPPSHAEELEQLAGQRGVSSPLVDLVRARLAIHRGDAETAKELLNRALPAVEKQGPATRATLLCEVIAVQLGLGRGAEAELTLGLARAAVSGLGLQPGAPPLVALDRAASAVADS